MTARPLAAAVALLALSLPGSASAASLPAGTTAIVSGAPSLLAALPAPVADAGSTQWAASTTGQYIAFASSSDGLVAGDDDRVRNVYVKDRASGVVTLASRATGAAGRPADADCFDPAISDDGTRVAFVCNGSLDPADTNGVNDIYVRDLATGTTFLASRASGLGAVADRSSSQPALSATGDYVAFASTAGNLGDPANGGQSRVYRRRIGNGDATIIVSRRSTQSGATPVQGADPSISDNGDRVAYASVEPVFGTTFDTNGTTDVFVYEVTNALVTHASRASLNGPVGNSSSRKPAISGNGNFVAFESYASNLSVADQDMRSNIFRRSLTGSTDTVLVDVKGSSKASDSYAPSIDASGNVVGFVSNAVNLHADDTNPGHDAYVKKLSAGDVELVSRLDGTGGAAANASAQLMAVSGDGLRAVTWLGRGVTAGADPRRASVIVRDLGVTPQRTFSVARPQGEAPFRNEGGASSGGALSADGRYIAFRSEASALGLPDSAPEGIFVRDRITGNVVFASRADGPDGAPIVSTRLSRPVISADGKRVAFEAARADGNTEVWVRDVATNRTFLASRGDGVAGAPGNGNSTDAQLDADGSRVSFTSYASNLDGDDTDQYQDVFVRDLAANDTILVSRANGANGAKPVSYSYGADISGDGTRVTFISEAKTLTADDTDTILDLFVRDLTLGTTRLVSAAPGGPKTDGSVVDATIDASGNRVAFAARSANLLGAGGPQAKVFVRDLAANTLVLASRASGAAGAIADRDAVRALISPDGTAVAFESDATNLVAGVPAEVNQSYRRDLAGATTELVSRAPNGRPATQQARPRGISNAGACVTFTTSDPLMGGSGDFSQSYLRTFRANCGDAVPAGAGADGGAAAGDAGAGTGADAATGQQRGQRAADTVAPVLSGVKLDRRRFRVGRAATALAAAARRVAPGATARTAAALRRGTTLRFRSSEAGTLAIAFERMKGRRVVRRAGTVRRRIRAGAGRVALSGRLGRRALAAGRYRLVVVATDAAGNRSKAVRLSVAIAR